MLEVRLLGLPQILVDENSVKLARRKTRAIFYFLAAQKQPVQRNKLLAIFWADEPRTAAQQVLRTTVYNLRHDLGDYLLASNDAVGLSEAAIVDVHLFDQSLANAADEPGMLAQALTYYRGDFLEGVDLPDNLFYEDWITVERERYRRSAVRALTSLSVWYESQKEYVKALDCLDRALRTNPLQEDLQRERIRLLYLAGDRPGAIRHYDEFRRLLDEAMGVPPMLETRALYDEILADRPRLLRRSAANAPRTPTIAAPQPIAGGRSASGFRLPFSGRVEEMKLVQDGLREHRLVLIEGEPGIGKTRVVEEYLAPANAWALVGNAHELEQNLPFLPVIEALRCIFAEPDWAQLQPSVIRDVPAVWLDAIVRLLPEQAEGLAGFPSPVGEVDELKIWEGVYRFLAVLSRYRSLILFIDNIHWADPSTIGLLGFLIRQPGMDRVRFLATSRSVPSRSKLKALLQAMTRQGKLQSIVLDRLRPEEVAHIAGSLTAGVNACFDPVQQPRLSDWLYKNSEGNPFILSELIRSLLETQRQGDYARYELEKLISAEAVPQSVFSLIQARLSSISETARRFLDTSVAVGREFEFQVVAQAAGLSENAALDAIDELIEAGLVLPMDGFRFKFDHHLTMEVAFQEVGELRHRLLHRRVAEAFETAHPEQLESLAGLLAWHYQEGNDPGRAARYAFIAGQQAARLAAWDEAINFYQQALTGFSGKRRKPVLIALGEAYSRSGNFSQATDIYHDILQTDSMESGTAAQDEIKLALAGSLLPQARFGEAIDWARQVLAGGDPQSAPKAEIIWGTALSIEGLDLDQAKDHLLAARRLCVEDRGVAALILAQVLFELGSVTAQQGDLVQAVQYYRDSLATINRVEPEQGLEQRILSYNNLAYHLHLLEDETAIEFAETGLALAREKGVIGLQAYLFSTLGEIALAHRNLDLAHQYFSEGLEIAERYALRERIAGLTANQGLVAIQQGKIDLAIFHLSRALGLADVLGTQHLAVQIRIWLAPLLPADEGRLHLQEAWGIAESSGRSGLLEEIRRLENQQNL